MPAASFYPSVHAAGPARCLSFHHRTLPHHARLEIPPQGAVDRGNARLVGSLPGPGSIL